MAKLECPLCCKPHFNDLEALRTTLVAATTTEIQCPVCHETQRGLDKFTIHLFTHLANTDEEIHVPETKPNLIQAATVPTVPNFEAPKISEEMPCPDISTRDGPSVATVVAAGIEEQITNVQNVLANEQRTIRCDICNFTFSDENILDMHQKLLHQTLEDKQTGLYSYHCHLCSKKFKMKGSLMVHLRVAHYGFGHNNKTELDLVASLNKFKKNEAAKNDEQPKKWSCDVCQKLFTTKYFLKKHKRLHTGEMPYFCAQCNKYFTFQQTYRKHMLYHSSEKPHVCQECGRAFKELSTLHNHERIHSGERPFACEFCGKCFRQRVSYLVHKRIHTGVLPYKCTACGKSYRYKVSQRSHKCTAMPPGDVIKTPTPSPATTSPTTATTHESDRDNLNLSLNQVNIVFNTDGQIIGQNFTFDGQNLITFNNSFPSGSHDTQVVDCKSIVVNEKEKEKVGEFYSLIGTVGNEASSEVTALTTHTSNMSISCNKMLSATMDTQEVSTSDKLQTINEESLKQLLYGAVNQ